MLLDGVVTVVTLVLLEGVVMAGVSVLLDGVDGVVMSGERATPPR